MLTFQDPNAEPGGRPTSSLVVVEALLSQQASMSVSQSYKQSDPGKSFVYSIRV
jgi:hypothetical protein